MHPSDGDLRGYLDGELPAGKRSRIDEHLRSCAECRSRRDALVRAAERVSEALDRLPVPDPRMDRARDAVRARTEGDEEVDVAPLPTARPSGDGDRPEPRSRRSGVREEAASRTASFRFGGGGPARAAAVVLLLVGGVAAGLPGSPVREWIGGLADPPSDPPAATAESSDAAADESSAAAVRVAPRGDSVRVVLVRPAPGTRVRVELVEASTLAVTAPAGTAFRSGAGRVEASGVRGELSIGIPRDVGNALVTAGARILVRKEGDALSLPSLEPEASDDGLRFRIPDDAPGALDGGRSP